MQLAERRGELIEKRLVEQQAAYLLVALRQRILAVPHAYARRILGLSDVDREGQSLSEPRGLDGVYALPHRRESSPELQRVQDEGAFEPGDLDSAPTGNTCFVLTEIYESKAGVLDHIKQAHENWGDHPAFDKWLDKCKATWVPAGSIINSLW
jgi:hypothetical protein